MRQPRAVVTGTSGYLGGAIADHLELRGWEVARVPGRERFAERAREIFPAGSATELVVHAGFAVDFRHAAKDEPESENVQNTRFLLEAARAGGARHFVFLGAAGALGVGATDLHARDETSAGMSDPEYGFWLGSRYIRDKLACERLVADSGVAATTLYLTTTYGPGMQARVRESLAGMRAGWRLVAPYPPGGTSFLGLKDLLAAIDLVVERRLTGAFVVSSGNLTYRELVRTILALAPTRKLRLLVPLPHFLFRILRRLRFTKAGLGSDTVLPSASGYKYYSPAKLMRHSAWRPRATLEESLAAALGIPYDKREPKHGGKS